MYLYRVLRNGVGARILAYKACGLVLSYYYLFRACGRFSSSFQRILTRWFDSSPRENPRPSILYLRSWKKTGLSFFTAIHLGELAHRLRHVNHEDRDSRLIVKAKRLFR